VVTACSSRYLWQVTKLCNHVSLCVCVCVCVCVCYHNMTEQMLMHLDDNTLQTVNWAHCYLLRKNNLQAMISCFAYKNNREKYYHHFQLLHILISTYSATYRYPNAVISKFSMAWCSLFVLKMLLNSTHRPVSNKEDWMTYCECCRPWLRSWMCIVSDDCGVMLHYVDTFLWTLIRNLNIQMKNVSFQSPEVLSNRTNHILPWK